MKRSLKVTWYRLRSGEPWVIILLSHLLRYGWSEQTQKWLLACYLRRVTHAANLMLLLHEVDGERYPEPVRCFAQRALMAAAIHPRASMQLLRRPWSRSEGWSVYLSAMLDFSHPRGLPLILLAMARTLYERGLWSREEVAVLERAAYAKLA